MYETDLNGSKVEVVFSSPAPPPPSPQASTEKEQGSNKGMLFLALGVTVIIIGLSGFLLYKHMKKPDERVGYRLA